MGRGDALSWMRKQKHCYNPEVLDALETFEPENRGQILSLNVSHISDGMVAAEDVMAKNGVMIIPKGQIITPPLLQGLRNFSMQVGVVEPIRVQIGQIAEETAL